MSTITVPRWDYHDKNIQGSIAQNDFTRADRIILFAAPTPALGRATKDLEPIGLIQGLTHNEQKQLQLFFELGSDAPMIIPGLTTGQISIQRVLLNGLNFLNAIYHGVNAKLAEPQILRSIRDVNVPFDLLMAKYPVLGSSDSNPGQTAKATESTLFRGCQISARSENVTSGGVVVMEQLSLMYATIPKVTFSFQ